MSLSRAFVRVLKISCLSVWVIGPSLLAAEPASEFVADLLHVAAPIHVTPEDHGSHFPPPRERGAMKATISPSVEIASQNLRGEVFDVSDALRKSRFTLPKGSHALYSPEGELLYLDSTFEDLEKAKAAFYSEKPRGESTMDVKVFIKSAVQEETLLDTKAIPLIEGRKMEFNTSGRESLHLIMMSQGAVFPDYGNIIEMGVVAEVRAEGKSVGITNTWQMPRSKPLETMLGRLGDATVTLRIQTHSRQGRWGDDAESEKENKAAAIKEIRTALEKDAQK